MTRKTTPGVSDTATRRPWPDPPELQHMAPQFRLGYRQAQDDAAEHMLPALSEGWFLASIKVRRDRAWTHGGTLTYDALLEGRGGEYEASGSGETPAAAMRKALEEISNAAK